MRTRLRRYTPPADANELLAALRSARVLSPIELRRFAVSWSESRPDEPEDVVEGTRLRARDLVEAGLMTAWQVERVLAGEISRLRIGPYCLLDWLGGGGMADVFKAEHTHMKRVVALKVLRDGPARAAGRREVEAAARLSHPNIVTAYDAVWTAGFFSLVMEYVEGIDLGRLVGHAGPLPVSLACEAARQTAHALQYAHERGLLHCDVKPANLMLVHPPRSDWDAATVKALADGPAPQFKLLDMGLARRLDDAAVPDLDDLDGTPDYMAPERGAGKPIDVRSDLYSLGCTLYHLLTARPPFPGGDGAAKVLRHRIDSPAPIRELRPAVPADVAAVVERLTARDPADRYETAAEAAEALDTVGRSLRERPGTESESVTRRTDHGQRPLAERAAYLLRWRLAAAMIAAGLVVGAAARIAMAPRAGAPVLSLPSASSPPPFVIDGRPGYGSLAEALAAADDGAVVTVHGAGPYLTPPLTRLGRSLTLRAAPGDRPCLELRSSGAGPWQTLLATDRDLTLEGLDLRAPPGGDASDRLICCEGAALRMTDCRLSSLSGAGIVFRNGGELTLRGCRVETGGTALSAEVGGRQTATMRIVDTTLAVQGQGGAALALWAREASHPTAVDVVLTRDAIAAGRILSLTALPAAVRITAERDEFTFRDALLSCAGYADRQGWRRATTWAGRDNRYHDSGSWLTVDGSAADVPDLKGWRRLWYGDGGGPPDATTAAARP